MDGKIKGAWIVHHSAKLNTVTDRADFENIQLAGKAAVLLSALSESDQVRIERPRVEALAKANGISVKLELDPLLQQLAVRELLETNSAGVDVLGVSSADVLKHASALFDSLQPSGDEQAAIVLAESASAAPLDSSRAAEQIADEFRMSRKDADDLLVRAADVGFVDSEDIDKTTRLIFNGNLFRRENAKKMKGVMASLKEAEQRSVTEAIEQLRRRGCVIRREIERILTTPVFEKLRTIGVFDVNVVANSQEEIEYVTHPQAFGKFGDPFADDALDLAKAFVSCLMYGMSRSSHSRGRITMLSLLLGKLIRGAEVGPATAIGEDYKVLEFKGVIRVRTERGGFYMRLLKPDIGELALKVLTEGDASAESLPNFPGATVSRYYGPELTRSTARRRLNSVTPKANRDVLVALRSGKN